jgi:nitroreductase
MDALQAIKTRRSIRAYQAKAVPREILSDLVDCGHLAATGRNEQPWEFVVITDGETIEKLGGLVTHAKFFGQIPACIAVFCRETKYAVEDGSAASQNILLAATAHGLGSCWVTGKAPYAEAVGQLLGAGGEMKLISLIAVGYAAEQPRKEKRALQDVLHWEHF